MAGRYPGNVRELKNIVERVVYMAQGEVLTAADVDAALPPEAGVQAQSAALSFEDDHRLPLPERVEALEAWQCKDVLERTRYKQKEAAALLGPAMVASTTRRAVGGPCVRGPWPTTPPARDRAPRARHR